MERGNGRTTKRAFVAVLAISLAVPVCAQSAQVSGKVLARRVALISIPDRQLAVMDGDYVIATFPVAVGAAVSPSPTGEFQIVSRVSNPTHYHQGKVIPTGKGNPLGRRWLGLSQKGYGIHGTNAPKSVGHAASHGCIRLRNRDMEQLFTLLRVGDGVVIRSERDVQITRVFGTNANDTTLADAQASPVAGGQ